MPSLIHFEHGNTPSASPGARRTGEGIGTPLMVTARPIGDPLATPGVAAAEPPPAFASFT